jgi:hypothetical protein
VNHLITRAVGMLLALPLVCAEIGRGLRKRIGGQP